MRLTITSCIVVFFSLWWLVFFIALPIGVQAETDVTPGCDAGAPSPMNLKKKAVYVTYATAGLFVIYVGVVLFFQFG